MELSDELLQKALDPEAFVMTRNIFGGSAPSATANVLDLQSETLSADQLWFDDTQQKLKQADQMLMDEIQDIL